MRLNASVTEISGVGPKYSHLLSQLEIKTVEDLLLHIPFRYEDRSKILKISELFAGTPATIIAEVDSITNIFTKFGKKFTRAQISDDTGKMEIIWFNQPYIAKSLKKNDKVSFSGTVDAKSRKPTFINPDWEKVLDDQDKSTIHTGTVIPIYNTTNGLTSKWLRGKIKEVIKKVEIDEFLPREVVNKLQLKPRDESIQTIHFPQKIKDTHSAWKRLAYEELLLLHLKGLKLRETWGEKKNSHVIEKSRFDLSSFIDSLPFKLTSDQNKSINEILADMQALFPMNRLLQGDVGSGKTVVAAAAISAAAGSNFNSILMAPTQVLANQHYESLKKFFPSGAIDIQLLTGSIKSINDSEKPRVIIATHSILHNLNKIDNVGLIVIDEQHKFGVAQRTEIVDYYSKDKVPNLLTMTATPIPRSLALTFYGDLSLSVISEMPVGRKKVKTKLVSEKDRSRLYAWIKKEIKENNNQVFVVCPFIEESESEEFSNVKAAEKEYEKISKIFKEFNIKLLHGRMNPKEKDQIILDFAQGKDDILVTTTVIEVGVDMPNANLILIETPERFGLASLHQLRGRVGRSDKQGYCVLVTESQVPESINRLRNLEKIHDGNKLAEIDMKIRGPGDIYGTFQHGFLNLKIADITDVESIKETKKIAKSLFHKLDNYSKLKLELEKILHVEDN